jgi:hypothetical protein
MSHAARLAEPATPLAPVFGNVPEAVCFTGAVRDVDPAYAIIRVDLEVEDDEARFTVRRIVWSEELAEAEVQRLQELNADKGARYLWQYTRVDRRSSA